jgi:hypothetical protein
MGARTHAYFDLDQATRWSSFKRLQHVPSWAARAAAASSESPTLNAPSLLGDALDVVSASRSQRDDQELERLAIAPMRGERLDQQAGALEGAAALQVRQSEGQDCVTNFGEQGDAPIASSKGSTYHPNPGGSSR